MWDALPLELLVAVLQSVLLESGNDLKTALRLDDVSQRVRAAMRKHIWPNYELRVDIHIIDAPWRRPEYGSVWIRINGYKRRYDQPILTSLKDKGIGFVKDKNTGEDKSIGSCIVRFCYFENIDDNNSQNINWKVPHDHEYDFKLLPDIACYLPPVKIVEVWKERELWGGVMDSAVTKLLSEHKQTIKEVRIQAKTNWHCEIRSQFLYVLAHFDHLDCLAIDINNADHLKQLIIDCIKYIKIDHLDVRKPFIPRDIDDFDPGLPLAMMHNNISSLTLYYPTLDYLLQDARVVLPSVLELYTDFSNELTAVSINATFPNLGLLHMKSWDINDLLSTTRQDLPALLYVCITFDPFDDETTVLEKFPNAVIINQPDPAVIVYDVADGRRVTTNVWDFEGLLEEETEKLEACTCAYRAKYNFMD